MGEAREPVDLTAEYEVAYNRHSQMLESLAQTKVDEVIEIGADCAARLELLALMLPENLIVSIAEGLQGETGEADEPSADSATDQGDGASEPARAESST